MVTRIFKPAMNSLYMLFQMLPTCSFIITPRTTHAICYYDSPEHGFELDIHS